MRTEVTGRRLDVTDAIREHAEKKTEKILNRFDGVQEIEVILDQDGPTEFTAETIVHVVKHDSIVSRAKGDDIYLAIDNSVNKATRQVQEFKERLRAH
jgi:putative sigma-54 modulation protein